MPTSAEKKRYVRCNKVTEWTEVIGVREEKDFPVQYDGTETFPRQWILADGTETSPLNPNLEIKEK